MKINIENLMNLFIDYQDTITCDWKASTEYYRKHGHGVYIAHARKSYDPEEEAVLKAYDDYHRSDYEITALYNVLGFDWTKTWHAAKAVKRWYEMTKYEKLMPESMKRQIENYITK